MKERKPVQPNVRVPKGDLHSWGVDYLRATSKTDAGKKAILIAWAQYRAQLERHGDVLKKGGMQGFKGESIGALFYGRKDDTFMLQVSGQLADEVFPKLPWEHLNCTRLDLQVTLQYAEDRPMLAAELGAARAKPFTDVGQEPDPIQSLDHNYGRGDTLDIGSRSSPRYGRIYDKQRESKDERYKRCWRFEIELKGIMAPKAVADLLAGSSLDRGVASLVGGQFAAWGIHITLPVAGRYLAGSIGRREFDSERSLTWLSSQVAPSIEKLLRTVDRETIIEALGLTERTEDTLPTITQEWLDATNQKAADEAKWAEGRAVLARR
jgi:DNA relaxase NicK